MWSCNDEFDALGYMQDCEENEDYYKKIEGDIFRAECYYRPARYMALRELFKQGLKAGEIDMEQLSQEESRFDNGIYFEVRFSLNSRENAILYGIGSQADYATRIDYLNQSVYRDFHLLMDDLSKKKASGHSFQNNFGAGKDCDISLVFPNDVLEGEQVELIYEDRIFGMEEACIRFSFKRSDIVSK